MYDELVKDLRESAPKALAEADFDFVEGWLKEAADAIEELSREAEEYKAIPAADVRPVVFCRDCKHRDPEDHKCDCGQLERAGCVFPVDDDYYCAYGVKREESRAEMRNRRIGND